MLQEHWKRIELNWKAYSVLCTQWNLANRLNWLPDNSRCSVMETWSCLLTQFRHKIPGNKLATSLKVHMQANIGATGEAMYDQRLFNQEGGMASGLASDDTYNLYDKNLWTDRGSNLYKPRATDPDEEAGADENARQFKPDKVQSSSSLVWTKMNALSVWLSQEICSPGDWTLMQAGQGYKLRMQIQSSLVKWQIFKWD